MAGPTTTDLTSADTHFAFGENWQSFTQILDESRIAEAEKGMRRLFPDGELNGVRFLDIGCGSGLSSLAAARLGATDIYAVDIDPNSVAATKTTLARYAPGAKVDAEVLSVFEISPEKLGRFDVVYSWGVLHHTGDMWRAVRMAAAMVKPGGLFAVALYARTPMCGFWQREKRFYSKAPAFVQSAMRMIFKAAFVGLGWTRGTKPIASIRNYRSWRGMDFSHDVHDWLGGYPYESASPDDVRFFLKSAGFDPVREFVLPPGRGLLGSGCNEFVVRAHAR